MPSSSTRKPRLLVLGSTFPARPNDGTPAFVLDLALQEAARYDVTVVTPMVRGAAATETLAGPHGDIQVHRYRYFWRRFEDLADGAILDNLKARKSRYLQVLPLVFGLWRAVRAELRDPATRPDVIHAHWVIPQGIVATIAAPKTALLITTHGGDIYALNAAPVLALKRWVFGRARRVTTVNSEMKAKLVSFGLPESKVRVLPMGVDTAEGARLAKTARKQPGQLLVVGRLVEKKGIAFLLDALRTPALAARVAAGQLKLKIIGDGPLRAELESQAAGLPVEFLGQRGRSEVLASIAESELMLIPSVTAESGDQEGLPVTLLEGGAGGVCVIASNLPGINEVIVDGESGLLVPQRDVPALAAAIEKCLDDPQLRTKLAAGVAVSVSRFDIATIGSAYCDELDLSLDH